MAETSSPGHNESPATAGRLGVANGTCAFGCGRAAVKRLKNGREICAEFAAQCPGLRRKNSEALRGRNPFANRPHPRGMAGKAAWNRGKSWEQMYGPEGAHRQRGGTRLKSQKNHAVLRSSPHVAARRRAKRYAQGR